MYQPFATVSLKFIITKIQIRNSCIFGSQFIRLKIILSKKERTNNQPIDEIKSRLIIFQKLHKTNNILLFMQAQRFNSLMSDQQSEIIEIYISIMNLSQHAKFCLRISTQEGNSPPKISSITKQYIYNGQRIDVSESVHLKFIFQVRQKIIIQLMNGNQSIGLIQSTLGEISGNRQRGTMKDITYHGKKSGSMLFRCEKAQQGKNTLIQFNLNSSNIETGSFCLCFGESAHFWRIYKQKQNQEYLIYQSELREGANCNYTPVKLSQYKLCNNNPQQIITLKMYPNGGGSSIGETVFTIKHLQQGNTSFQLNKNGKAKGRVAFQNFRKTVLNNFWDFRACGMQISLVACIDFTASNQLPKFPASYHYFDNYKKSAYQEALAQVCNIVLDYDDDKLVPSFGFGAKVNMPNLNTGPKTHHCFPLNGDLNNPYVFQLDGIIASYRNCLQYLTLSGPTFFAPLLSSAMQICKRLKQQTKQYMILLILTDGMIHDKLEVFDLLIQCSRLPLSIIIIGIGNGEDWTAMHQLDDDEKNMVDSKGNHTERDLVQFVEFSQYHNNGVALAEEVLRQLPRQVEQYHKLINIPPEAYSKNKQKLPLHSFPSDHANLLTDQLLQKMGNS